MVQLDSMWSSNCLANYFDQGCIIQANIRQQFSLKRSNSSRRVIWFSLLPFYWPLQTKLLGSPQMGNPARCDHSSRCGIIHSASGVPFCFWWLISAASLGWTVSHFHTCCWRTKLELCKLGILWSACWKLDLQLLWPRQKPYVPLLEPWTCTQK